MHCWAHARRKLKEIFDRHGSEIAAEGLRRIAELCRIEAEIRGMNPGQWLSARQARSAPLVAAFGARLQLPCRRISMKSRLGEELAYIYRHWDGLQTFLCDGRVEIDSNSVEDLIRPIALTRKNALFAGHDKGGRSWARIASLIATAEINSVEPFAYLKTTLEAVAAGHPQARIDDPAAVELQAVKLNASGAKPPLTVNSTARTSPVAVSGARWTLRHWRLR